MSKSKLSHLLKGRSVPNLPSYSSPWNKNDEKLWNAVKQQNVKQIKSILSKASITATKLGPQGKSVFHLACEMGNDLIVDLILAGTQDINDTTIQGVTALQCAAAKGHTNTVNKLLKKKASVDQRDANGMTALHHACFGQHKDCVKALLIKNADVNIVEQGGKTPLFYSAHLGYLDICRWLLEKGADVNCQDKDNVTPLMLAAKEGHRDVCELLLKHGANPSVTDRYDKTALVYAVSSKDLELQEVFATSYKPPFASNKPRNSISLSESGSHYSDYIEPRNYSRSQPFVTENEVAGHIDAISMHSMDDCLLSNRQFHVLTARPHRQSRIEQVYNVDETEVKFLHKTSADETTVKSIKTNCNESIPKDEETALKFVHGTRTDETVVKPIKREVDDTVPKVVTDNGNLDVDNTLKKEAFDDQSKIIDLNKHIVASEKANEKLKSSLPSYQQVSHAYADREFSEKYNQSQVEVKMLSMEKEQLEMQIIELREQSEKQQYQRVVKMEEVIYQNNVLTKDVESLKLVVASLQEELKVTKSESSIDAQRIDDILAASDNFEEVNFDKEGFVEGRDITKEEFLQGQNQNLKAHCGHLTVELEKLKLTFDAILKAGDNLQSDYDHLALEKDALQDELETTIKEKRDVIAENEVLLADNNELHENLKKIVHELEKMQEKYQATHLENDELKRSVTVASKVGEVARLLEERAVLQQRCADLESTSQRLQHDHDILLEEVQSLNDSLNQLIEQRNQHVSDLEELESICQQHEALQVEYNQLEMDFAEVLKDKEALEQQISNNNEEKEESQLVSGSDTSSLEMRIKELTVDKQQLEIDKQELEDVVNGLSRHIVTTENVVKGLENNLQHITVVVESQKLAKMEMSDQDSKKLEDLEKKNNEIINLKKQIAHLTLEIEEWEKKHADTVTTYRTHLLSAVQGHMDPDVKDALYHIIELRSMEQFC